MRSLVTDISEQINLHIHTVTTEEVTAVHACPKCGGSGYLSEFSHVSSGVCFKCDGSGDAGYRTTETVERKEHNRNGLCENVWLLPKGEIDLMAIAAARQAEREQPVDIFSWFEES